MSLIYEHMSLDVEERESSLRAPEGEDGVDYNTLESERDWYEDPDFDEYWETGGEPEEEPQEPIDSLDENESFEERDGKGQDQPESDFGIEDEWEEVE